MNRANLFTVMAITSLLALLTGCSGMRTSTAPSTVSIVDLKGQVLGGRQPIANATIDVWQAGTSGYATGATKIGTVMTDANGSFDITNAHPCTSGTQIYITSTGGNPGLSSGGASVTNNAAVLMAALGLCDNVNPTNIPYIKLNELSTVASVWSLSEFIGGYNVGTSSTNTAGLSSAFADFNSLVSLGSGMPIASTSTVTQPMGEILTLGNILSSCVNSTGVGDGGACDRLFSDTTVNGVKPTNTLLAAINISRYPSQNASDLLMLATPTAPYQPGVSNVNDFTIAITYTGSGISAPAAAAVDASGNVWIANASSVTELSHAGTVLSGNGYTASLSSPSAIAIASDGTVWVTNKGNNTVSRLSSTGVAYSGSPYANGGLSSPASISFDSLGNAWIANSGNASVTAISGAGSTFTNYTPAAAASPIAIAVDPH